MVVKWFITAPIDQLGYAMAHGLNFIVAAMGVRKDTAASVAGLRHLRGDCYDST